MPAPPDVEYIVLSSRLAPDRDGGYAVAVSSRLELLRTIGVTRPLLLTFDVGAANEPARPGAQAPHPHRHRGFDTRNLFDEIRSDSSWLYEKASEGRRDPDVVYRAIHDVNGREVVSLPVIDGDPWWYLTKTPVVVGGDDGQRILTGFRDLYMAWLTHVVEQLRTRAGDDERCVVVICESKQLGELIAGWSDPNVRVVHTVHNSHLTASREPASAVRDDGWRRWLALLDRFDAVIWPTASQMRDVADRFGTHEGFAAVPTPITPPAHPSGPRRRGMRDVLMVNRLVTQKRVDAAISAWPHVLARVPDARLHIYGDGPLRGELRGLIEERGLTQSIHLHGYSEHAREAMAISTVFLCTSAFEGQNLAIGEALSSGLPVIAFDVRYGPRDYVGGGGVLVPADDIEGVAAAVSMLLSDAATRDRLSERAREESQRLTPEAIGEAFARLLEDVVARPARRSAPA